MRPNIFLGQRLRSSIRTKGISSIFAITNVRTARLPEKSIAPMSRTSMIIQLPGVRNLEIYIGVPAIDRFSERFPYFDRGLGVMLTSKRHRREVMRQKGVVAVDGDLDIGASARKSEAIKKEDEAILADMKHRLEHHPGYKEYRQLRDRGWKPTKTVRREQ